MSEHVGYNIISDPKLASNHVMALCISLIFNSHVPMCPTPSCAATPSSIALTLYSQFIKWPRCIEPVFNSHVTACRDGRHCSRVNKWGANPLQLQRAFRLTSTKG